MALSFNKPRSFEQVQRLFEQLDKTIRAAGLLWKFMGSGTEVRWNIGSTAITWPGASSVSNSLVINHGLGATPDIVLSIATSDAYNATAFTYTSTTFTGRARTVDASTPGVGASGTLFWLAISVT